MTDRICIATQKADWIKAQRKRERNSRYFDTEEIVDNEIENQTRIIMNISDTAAYNIQDIIAKLEIYCMAIGDELALEVETSEITLIKSAIKDLSNISDRHLSSSTYSGKIVV